jgi:hypothetical protein
MIGSSAVRAFMSGPPSMRFTTLFKVISDYLVSPVMPGLVPGIHVFGAARKAWMAGTSPA